MGSITDKAMQAKPAAKDIWLNQPFRRGAGGFVGRIRPNGERLFYFRYTNSDGERPYLPLGAYHPKGVGGLTVAAAYAKAQEMSALYQSGVKDLHEHFEQLQAQRLHDQAQEEQARAEAALVAQRRLTVRQLFQRWQATDLQPGVRADGKRTGRKDGGEYVRQQFERHVFPTIGDLAAADLRKADVLTVIDAQTAKGQARTASVLLSDLRQMMSFALDRELIEADPLATLKKSRIVGSAVERERHLSQDEVRALADALPQARLHPRSEAAIWLLLATGARVGELMGAVWADALPAARTERTRAFERLQALAEADGVKAGIVDLDQATWHLPDTKNQRPHTIHLSGFALARFRALHALREPQPDGQLSPWAFPARQSVNRPVCVKSFGKQLADRQRPAAARMAGRSLQTESLMLPGGRWTAHDLRRTTGTLMASLGVSGDVIDECLNHMIESRVRRTYIRDRRHEEQAAAFDALGQLLQRLLTLEPTAGQVIPLRRVAA